MSSATPAAALLLVGALVLAGYDSAAAETIPCENVLPGHKMTGSPSHKHTFMDGRTMTGRTYNVGGCGPTAEYPTGKEYQTNYTFMSYNSPVTSPACLVKKDGDKGVYDSFQGVVIEANGFRWTPKLSVDDIDALPTTVKYGGEVDGWRESALVFGVAKGKVVYPSLALSSGTMLKQKTYVVKRAALAEMGLGALGDLQVVGSEFNEDKPFYNCPFSDAAMSSRCRMTVEFTEPINKLVILYGAAHKVCPAPRRPRCDSGRGASEWRRVVGRFSLTVRALASRFVVWTEPAGPGRRHLLLGADAAVHVHVQLGQAQGHHVHGDSGQGGDVQPHRGQGGEGAGRLRHPCEAQGVHVRVQGHVCAHGAGGEGWPVPVRQGRGADHGGRGAVHADSLAHRRLDKQVLTIVCFQECNIGPRKGPFAAVACVPAPPLGRSVTL
jgi:hypothetical protein